MMLGQIWLMAVFVQTARKLAFTVLKGLKKKEQKGRIVTEIICGPQSLKYLQLVLLQ